MGHGLYVLYLSFKFDLEKVSNDFLKIGKAIGPTSYPVLHGKWTNGFVIQRNESLEDLEKRLRPLLDSIYSLDNWWLSPAPTAIKAKNNPDPFQSRLLEGWNRIRQRRYGKYIPDRQTG